ncbi:MAG TPA: methionyl-tRNA formyltransferase [Coriobacteriia bacterium]|jgi:methionyl-tRNA formyltransferase
MRVVFMGTPPFAVPSLLALAGGHEVVAVYTRPDKPAGRGRGLHPSAVKQAALGRGLELRQPATLADDAVVSELRSFAPDVVAVAAFGVILPRALLDVARIAPVNVHASLLPRWRGAAPVQRAILAGDESTGVTIMRMTEGLDTGPYCLQREVAVDDHTTLSLTAELAEVGAVALVEALHLMEDGTAVWTDQDDSSATYADKVSAADVALSPDLPVIEAYRRIRASNRQAPSRACIGSTGVTVTAASWSPERVEPGVAHSHGSALMLGFADGALEITQLTPQGRASMQGAAYARGARLGEGTRWGACRAG